MVSGVPLGDQGDRSKLPQNLTEMKAGVSGVMADVLFYAASDYLHIFLT